MSAIWSKVSLVEEKAVEQLIELMRLTHPCIEDIVIGCPKTDEGYMMAMKIKEAWEQLGGFTGEGGTVLDIVCWNDQSSSFNKYSNRIIKHYPDAFVAVGTTIGFKEINKRLHRFSELTAEKIYILGDYSETLNSLFCERLTGVSWSGRPWKISRL